MKEEILIYSRTKEHVYKVNPQLIADGATFSIDSTTPVFHCNRGEILKDLWIEEGLNEWSCLLLTSSRIVFLSSELRIAKDIPFPADSDIEFLGMFEENLIFQDKSYLYYHNFLMPQKELIKLLALDSMNEKAIQILPDRILIGHAALDFKEKEVRIELLQRQSFNTELLLASLVYRQKPVSPELLESLISIFWDSSFSTIFLKNFAKLASEKIHLELIAKYGSLDILFEEHDPSFSHLNFGVKEFLQSYVRDYLSTSRNGSQELTTLIKTLDKQSWSALISSNLSKKINALKICKILPPETTLENLAQTIAPFDDIRRVRKFKRLDVAFGQDPYKLQDPIKDLYFPIINPKELTNYYGLSKPKMSVTSEGGDKNESKSDEEEQVGFEDDDEDECKGLLCLWRFDEDICPDVKDTTDNNIRGIIKGSGYRYEPFRGDSPLEGEDKWGKVGFEF